MVQSVFAAQTPVPLHLFHMDYLFKAMNFVTITAVSCQIKSTRLKWFADYLGALIGERALIRENTVLTKAQTWFLLFVITHSHLRICVRFVKSSSVSHC